MHIGFLTPEYPPGPTGGVGTSVRNLSRALVNLGHQVSVIGWGERREFVDQGVAVRFLPATRIPKAGWLLNRLAAAKAFNQLVRDKDLAIVEAPDWGGLSAFMRLHCPMVVRCNGSATYFGDILRERVRPSVRWAERAALSQAAAIVAVSHFAATTTKSLFRLRQPISVIPNGIDVRQFSVARPEDTEPATILYFGSIVRKKGVLDLPSIMECVWSKLPEAKLHIVGRDVPDRLTGATSTWSLVYEAIPPLRRPQVMHRGALSYDQVAAAIKRSAVCIFPSYAEAFPLAWIEAMACAKPIVAYDIGWASEIVRPGNTGMLVPSGDASAFGESVVSLLQNRAGAEAMGIAARNIAELEFDADVIARRSLAWYEKVLGRR